MKLLQAVFIICGSVYAGNGDISETIFAIGMAILLEIWIQKYN